MNVGGTIWRTDTPAWFADSLVPGVNLADGLTATGKLRLDRADADSGFFIGWWNEIKEPCICRGSMAMCNLCGGTGFIAEASDMCGMRVTGASAVGYFAVPYLRVGAVEKKLDRGPLVFPDGVERMAFVAYDPAAHQLQIAIGNVTPNGEPDDAAGLDAPPGLAATFTRFGVHTLPGGGHAMVFRLSELEHTR